MTLGSKVKVMNICFLLVIRLSLSFLSRVINFGILNANDVLIKLNLSGYDYDIKVKCRRPIYIKFILQTVTRTRFSF